MGAGLSAFFAYDIGLARAGRGGAGPSMPVLELIPVPGSARPVPSTGAARAVPGEGHPCREWGRA